MYQILCIEDSEEVQLVLRKTLMPTHTASFASTIEEARIELNQKKFDLIVLDINLPDGDGLRFCSELKSSQDHGEIPIFILTGNQSIQDKTLGFQLGIEDFIVKPFVPMELKIRIESRLKKISSQKQTSSIYKVGNLTIDFSCQRAGLDSSEEVSNIELSSTEFKILGFLIKNKEQVKSREQIIQAVWGDGLHLSDRTIDSHISRIRKKILKCDYSLEAVQNYGYRFTLKQKDKKAA
jgi:DNA-binding response OmpR family regulator